MPSSSSNTKSRDNSCNTSISNLTTTHNENNNFIPQTNTPTPSSPVAIGRSNSNPQSRPPAPQLTPRSNVRPVRSTNNLYHSDPIPLSPPPTQDVDYLSVISQSQPQALSQGHGQGQTQAQGLSQVPPKPPTKSQSYNDNLRLPPRSTSHMGSSGNNGTNNNNGNSERSHGQFNALDIERSFQALLKKQPMATSSLSTPSSKGAPPRRTHLHPQDKPSHFLSPGSSSSQRQQHHYPHRQQQQQQQQRQQHHRHQGFQSQPSSSGSNSLSHSPIFGSPATDHARHWLRSVGAGRDHVSDSESEQRESDQDLGEENLQQQWQVDYDHHVAAHVELETEQETQVQQQQQQDRSKHMQVSSTLSGTTRRLSHTNTNNGSTKKRVTPVLTTNGAEMASGSQTSSWTSQVHPMFSMADPMGSKEQGLMAPTAMRPSVRSKEHPTIHPLSPVPPSPITVSGQSTPAMAQSRSPEIRPQVIVHPSDQPSGLGLVSIPPLPPNAAIFQPLPPVPTIPLPPTITRTPSPTANDTPRTRYKQSRNSNGSSQKIRGVPSPSAKPAPKTVAEKKPVSLSNPPRKCIHHGKILQVINTSTVKDRYLFLFNDLLLIAKPMSDGHPSLDSRFQVKDVIELKKISLSLSRDKYDSKSGDAGLFGNRKIPPILADFIHTFDQNPVRALNSFIQKRALHPDPVSVAHLLFRTPELSKSQLALFLSNPANRHVYRAFLDECQFAGVLLDDALRSLLSRLSLPERVGVQQGTGDKIVYAVDYLIEEFTRRWYEANVNVVVFDASIALKLVISMIVLNAQLHNNEGAVLVKGREEVGILVRPRVNSQPSTPTIPSTPIIESSSSLSSTPNSTLQHGLVTDLDDLTAFSTPTKDSFVESFQLLDQQQIVPRDTLQNIFTRISQQPFDIDSDKPEKCPVGKTAGGVATPGTRKLWPIMVSPAVLPPRLTLKIPSDPITITVPALNPHFSIQLGGRDLKCEPAVLEFGSHRSQRFRVTGTAPGKKTLSIRPKLAIGNGEPEQYYDLRNLPMKHTVAVERQFMRHTFQVSLLNDLGTRRRYLFGTSSGAEKDEWARVLTECLVEVKGQNAARLNEHTGLEQSIGLQILKELLLGVEASDEDDVPASKTGPEIGTVPMPMPAMVGGAPMGLGIPMEGHLGALQPVNTNTAAATIGTAGGSSSNTHSTNNGHSSPTLGTGVMIEWSNASNTATTRAQQRDAWMCKMPKAGSAIPDRDGWEVVKLVEQNSLMALMLGFMGALGRDRIRRMEAKRQADENEAKMQARDSEVYENEDEGDNGGGSENYHGQNGNSNSDHQFDDESSDEEEEEEEEEREEEDGEGEGVYEDVETEHYTVQELSTTTTVMTTNGGTVRSLSLPILLTGMGSEQEETVPPTAEDDNIQKEAEQVETMSTSVGPESEAGAIMDNEDTVVETFEAVESREEEPDKEVLNGKDDEKKQDVVVVEVEVEEKGEERSSTDLDEEGVVTAVSGRGEVRKAQGKEIWWTQ
ncbi:hypothetical protein BGZ94_001143 [Podila epigama]|nr:hypothetical protein BGZ94_001143 [Podila epigama]